MKTKDEKRLKLRASKVSTKRVKAKLPQYKVAKRGFQGRKKSFLKCLPVDSIQSVDVESAENLISPSTSHELKRNVKIRKKKSERDCRLGRKTIETKKYTTDIFSGSNSDSDKTDLKKNDNEKKQRNLGSPVVVEALSVNFSSMTIPEQFRHYERETKGEEVSNEFTVFEKPSSKEDVLIARWESTEDSPRNKDKLEKGRQSTAAKEDSSQYAKKVEPTHLNMENVNISTENIQCSENAINENLETVPHEGSAFPNESPPRFYVIKNKVIVLMEERTRFSFVGKVLVNVIYGAIDIYGWTITPESTSVEVYSPRGYGGSIAIETNRKLSPHHTTDIWAALSTQGITSETENKLVADVNKIRPGMAVFLLSRLENKLTKFLYTFFPFKLFPKIKNTTYLPWTDPRRAELILQSNIHFMNSNSTILTTDPRVTLEVSKKMLDRWHANEWSCTLVAGGKSVGKSTAVRYLINSLLPTSKMVVLVDVDPGQAECTPLGCISYTLIEHPLLGPNFTHLKRPIYQLYIGYINVQQCVSRYVDGVKMMIRKLLDCPKLSRLPIVVNTMGFTQALGWDIAVFTIKLIRPSFVIQIMSKTAKNNFGNYLSKEVINKQNLLKPLWSTNVIESCEHELVVIRSLTECKGGTDFWDMEPYQKRELVLISYLSQIVQSAETSLLRYIPFTYSINDAVPFVTPFSSLYISIAHKYVPASHVLSVINGNIVALCGLDLTGDDFQENQNNTTTTTCIQILRRMPLCACYGFGIVRAIDMDKEELYINTPLSASMMQRVNCLIGCIPIPATLLQLSQQRNIPYAGDNDVVPTSREPRRGYFRMRYKSNN